MSEIRTRVRALYFEALLVARQGNYGRSMTLYGESLTLVPELGDQKGILWSLFGRAS